MLNIHVLVDDCLNFAFLYLETEVADNLVTVITEQEIEPNNEDLEETSSSTTTNTTTTTTTNTEKTCVDMRK